MSAKTIVILGCRGVPGGHGGFETFAENLAPFLVERGWVVIVYCQVKVEEGYSVDEWRGVRRVNIPCGNSPFSTVIFDLKSIWNSRKANGLILTLGYNTAILNLLHFFAPARRLMNMDGFEWRRSKWPFLVRIWFYINEWIGSIQSQHLIADHPEVEKYFSARVGSGKVSMAPYGAKLYEGNSSRYGVEAYLPPGPFALVIARPEPENQLLEIVNSFCKSNIQGKYLVILGSFNPSNNLYHRSVLNAANSNVVFPGAIYDGDITAHLRAICHFYIHGHTVGGTNPTLVEALGAGAPILAHDNVFNRWVAGEGAEYFQSSADLSAKIVRMFKSDLSTMGNASTKRFKEAFNWDTVLNMHLDILDKEYEKLSRGIKKVDRS